MFISIRRWWIKRRLKGSEWSYGRGEVPSDIGFAKKEIPLAKLARLARGGDSASSFILRQRLEN
ncbi:MAG: hypothetical protein WBM40_06400, partial [Thiohalocapsa sp.]